MILAVTSNPAIDRTVYVPEMKVGAVHRASSVHLAAGGKGLNISRAVRQLGQAVLATGPLAGRAGQIVADLAQAEGLAADWYWLGTGETRMCLLINHQRGDATVINEPGPAVSPADWTGFAGHVQDLAQKVQVVALAGSLPPGAAPEALGDLARSLAGSKRAIYVDTSGPVLAALLAQPQGLAIKVNRSELAAGLGLALGDHPLDRLIEAGHLLLKRGAVLVVVTLGQEGAMAVSPGGSWLAKGPPVEIVSTVGSGDSMLAGLMVARLEGLTVEAALAFGVACGSANVMTDLPGRFNRTDVETLLGRITTTRL